jgi:lysophospholipase L1-like esterase
LGKYTYYNSNLYRCISPIETSEEFTAAHWTQVKLGDDVSALKSALKDTETYVIGRQNLLNYTEWTTDEYMAADGTIYQAVGGWYTDLMTVIPSESYTLIGNVTGTGYPIYVLGYKSNGDFHELLAFINGAPAGHRTVDFTIPDVVTQVRVSGVVNTALVLVLSKTVIDLINEAETEIDGINDIIKLTGVYKPISGFDGITTYPGNVTTTGEILDGGTGWVRSDYIPTGEGAEITASLKGYSTNPIVAFFDANKQYLSDVSILSDAQRIVSVNTVVPSGVEYAIFVSQTNYDGRSFEIGSTATISEAFGIISDEIRPYKDINVVCMGDSLTAGRDGLGNILVHNYPYYMKETSLKDCNIKNLGAVGTTTKTYWDSHKADIDVDANTDLVLCMWGTNGGLVDTGALATDVEPYNNYEDYADTGVGCYCKIIEYVMELSQNHAQIILITPPYNGNSSINDRVINAQAVVKQIAERYNLPVIDMFKCGIGKFNFSTFMPDDSVHFNEVGYKWIGTYIGSSVDAVSAYKNVL